MGIFTLLKNGAPTLMRSPVIHSEKTGKRVPEESPHSNQKNQVIEQELDSRETIESS